MKHIVHSIMVAVLFIFIVTSAQAQKKIVKYRAACPGIQTTRISHHSTWTTEPATAFFDASVKSVLTSRRCWVDRKRSFLGIRMPSQRIHLSEKERKEDKKAH